MKKGKDHEQVQESIARSVALSIPFGVGAEISISDTQRAGW